MRIQDAQIERIAKRVLADALYRLYDCCKARAQPDRSTGTDRDIYHRVAAVLFEIARELDPSGR